MSNLVLSASGVSQYLKCHHAYLLGTVYRMPRREGLRALIGTAVHAGVEAMLRGHEPEPAVLSAWDEGIGRVDAAEVAADPAALADAKAMPHVYRAEVMPTYHPDIIEAGFAAIPKGMGVTITGVIDNAESATDDLRDLKSTAGKTVNGVKPSFSPESHDLQGGLYRLGYYALTGRWPKTYRLDVLTRRGTYRQYERTPSTADALDMVAIVRDGVNAADFEPTGATAGICGWCEYARRCAHARV